MLHRQISDGIEMIESRGGKVKLWGSPLGLATLGDRHSRPSPESSDG